MEATIYITQATYVDELSVNLHFSNGVQRTVNIGEFIKQNPHPQYNKYLQPMHFKKFKLEEGNIVWGKNWDLIFPIEQLYNGRLN